MPKVTQLDSSRARILSLSESTGVHTSRKPHQQGWKQRWEDARPMVLKSVVARALVSKLQVSVFSKSPVIQMFTEVGEMLDWTTV